MASGLSGLRDLQRIIQAGAETDGAVQLSIDVPRVPQRGRYPLDVRLCYSSAARNGTAGVGWMLSEEYVEEVAGGLHWVSAARRVRLDPVGGQPGRFRPVQSEEERTFERLDETAAGAPALSWAARDELGNHFRYASQLALGWPSAPARRWYLTRVRDADGNHADYHYEDEEVVEVRRSAPPPAPPYADAVLEFFNNVSTPEEITERIHDDPDFRVGPPRAYGVRYKLAERVLKTRDERYQGQFTSVWQIDAIYGVGPDTLHDIVHTLTGAAPPHTAGPAALSDQIATLAGPYLAAIEYNHHATAAAETPYSRIRCEWKPRQDPCHIDLGGASVLCDRILHVIHAEALTDDGPKLYRRLVLAHVDSPETARALLQSIVEVGGEGGGAESLRLRYSEPATRAFKQVELAYDAATISSQRHFRKAQSLYGEPVLNTITYASDNAYLDQSLLDLDDDGVPELVRTHQLFNDKLLWQIERALPANHPAHALAEAGNPNRPLFASEIPVGLRYHDSIYPTPGPGYEGNNWQIFTTGREYLPMAEPYRQILGAFAALWRGGPTSLVLPWRYHRRFQPYDQQGNPLRLDEAWERNDNRWMVLENRGTATAVFDHTTHVDVSRLRPLAERFGYVPIQESTELHSLGPHPDQTHYVDFERLYTNKFLADLDGDGVAEYVLVADDGRSWLVAKLTPPTASSTAMSFGNFTVWSVPAGAQLRPFLERTDVEYQDPLHQTTTDLRSSLIDVTGSGRPDYVEILASGALKIYYNTGTGFEDGPTIPAPPTFSGKALSLRRTSSTYNNKTGHGTTRLLDGVFPVDQSGLPHWVELRSPARLWLRHLFADRWSHDAIDVGADAGLDWKTGELFSSFATETFRFTDFWADGRVGALQADGTSATRYVTGCAVPPDLLVGIDNGCGHEIELEYALAGDFLGASFQAPHRLRRHNTQPLCIHIRERDVPAGVDRRVAFWYSQPVFDDSGARVLWYRAVDRIDAGGNVARTHKTPSAGRPVWVTVTVVHDPTIAEAAASQPDGAAPHLFHDVVRPYFPATGLDGGDDFLFWAKPVREVSLNMGGRPGRVLWSSDRRYDDHGGSLSSSVTMEYTAAGFLAKHETSVCIREVDHVETPGFRGLIAEERLRSPELLGKLVRRVRNYYDDLPLGECGERGRLTRTEVEHYTTGPGTGSPERTSVSTFEYDAHGLLLADVQLDAGVEAIRTEHSYDPRALWRIGERIIDRRGGGTTLERGFVHDPVSHLRTSVATASGSVSRTEYDGLGRPVRELVRPSAAGPEYLLKELRYQVDDRLSMVEEKEYNKQTRTDAPPRSQLLATTRTYISGSGLHLATQRLDHERDVFEATSTSVYDGHGRRVRAIERHTIDTWGYRLPAAYHTDIANMTLFEHGPTGEVVSEVRARGTIGAATAALEPHGRTEYVRRVRDVRMVTSIKRFSDLATGAAVTEESWLDVWGRVVKTVDGEGQVVDLDYDLNNQLVAVRRGAAQYTFERDSQGKLVRLTDPDVGLTWRRLDSFGNTIEISSKNLFPVKLPPVPPVGALVQGTSDAHWVAMHRLIDNTAGLPDEETFQSLFPLELSEHGYGSGDWIDALAAFVWTNRAELRAALPDPPSAATAQRFVDVILGQPGGDAALAALWFVTRPNPILRCKYDHLQRRLEESVWSPVPGSYKGAWKVIHEEDAAQRISYRYDTYSSTTLPPDEQRRAMGSLTEVVTTREKIEIGYDWLGAPVAKTWIRDGQERTSIRYVKDLGGRAHAVSHGHGEAFDLIYQGGVLTEVRAASGSGERVFGLQFDDQARVEHIDLPETMHDRTYQPVFGYTDHAATKAHTVAYADELELDALGRAHRWDRTRGGAATRSIYGYDGAHRLRSVLATPLGGGAPGGLLMAETMREYDGFNNLTASTRTERRSTDGGGSAVTTSERRYTYAPISNRPHLMESATLDGVSHAVGYDTRGILERVTGEQGRVLSFEHDARGRIRRVRAGSDWYDLEYDGEGQLARLRGSDGSDVEYFGREAFFDHIGATWGTHVGAAGMALATKLVTGGQARYVGYRLDSAGDVVGVVDQSASGAQSQLAIAEDLSFVYSNPTVPLAYLPPAIRGGRPMELGGWRLIRFGSRLYVVDLEVFTSPDPVIGAVIFHGAYNRYRFGYNCQPNVADPTGYSIEGLIFAAVIGAIIGAIAGLEVAGWQGALVGAAIGAAVGALSYWLGMTVATALGKSAAAQIVGYGIKEAIFNAVRAGTLAAVQHRNVVIAVVAGAFIGFVAGALEGAAQGYDVFSFQHAGLIVASSMVKSGFETALEGGDFWQGAAMGAILGVVNYTFRALDHFFSKYEGMIIDRVIGETTRSTAAVSTVGGLKDFLIEGFVVNVVSRSVIVGLGVALPIYLATENWGLTLVGFATATVVSAIPIGLYELYQTFDMDIGELTRRNSVSFSLGGRDGNSMSISWGRFYGLVPFVGRWIGGVMAFQVTIQL